MGVLEYSHISGIFVGIHYKFTDTEEMKAAINRNVAERWGLLLDFAL